MHILAYRVEDRFCGLPLSEVERVVPAVEVIPLIDAPPAVLGVINVAGGVLPVVSVRRVLGLPERPMELSDRLIIARWSSRRVALLADSVEGVLERSESEVVRADRIVDGPSHLDGVLKLRDGLLLIHDLEMFLSLIPTGELHEPAACQ